jgi:type I restriction enzyme S subunit
MNPLSDWYQGVRADWPMVPLRGVAAMGTGHTPDRTKPEYWENCTIPWVTAADLSARPSEFEPLTETAQHVSHLGVANSSAVVHPAETVMFCRTASVGLLTITDKPMVTTQAFVTWTAGPELLPRYLLFSIAAMRPELMRIAYGSTHLTIYMPDLKALEIPAPPLDEQRRIADFLDDQVARLDHTQQKTRSQRSLSLERFRTSLSHLTLERNTGERRETPLRHLFDYERNGIWGGEPSGGPDDISCVRVADFDRGRFVANLAPTVRSVPSTQRAPRLLRRGDVLLEKSGGTADKPVGCAVSYDSDEPAVCSNFVAVLRPRRSVHARFAALVMAALYQTRQNGPFVTQTTGIQNLDSNRYLGLTVGLPSQEKQAAIAEELDAQGLATQEALAHLARRSDLIEERKQALITAAVTGQFDVSTARSVG